MSDISGNAVAMGLANKSQMGGAMVIQSYTNSALQQPKVDFSGFPSLQAYQKQINDGLAVAQGHANYYLNTLQSNLISNMGNIYNYYVLNKTLPVVLPAGSTEVQWINMLSAVKAQSQNYYSVAKQIVMDLRNFSNQLDTDSQAFNTTITELNSKVGGDEGVLQDINDELDKIQLLLDAAITGSVISALTTAAGVFTICVGSIEDFVTAGVTTPLIFGGIGIFAAGVSGEAGSIAAIIQQNNAKATLLNQEASLTAEVKLATTVSRGYSSLSSKVKAAAEAATTMANAWANVNTDFEEIINDLNQGIISADSVRTMFVTATNEEIATLLQDIQTIKEQMSGVTVQCASPGQTVSQLVASLTGQ